MSERLLLFYSIQVTFRNYVNNCVFSALSRSLCIYLSIYRRDFAMKGLNGYNQSLRLTEHLRGLCIYLRSLKYTTWS
uniref:Uncharacterized protein n=1 Tax=Anguilla anguilla TaxID=7936 RepID=A0A0E9U899_ANGAN